MIVINYTINNIFIDQKYIKDVENISSKINFWFDTYLQYKPYLANTCTNIRQKKVDKIQPSYSPKNRFPHSQYERHKKFKQNTCL